MINLEQIRAARAMLDLKQQELAEKAGISTGTLNNIERGVQTDPKMSTVRAIQKALEAEGIEFTEEENGSFGIKLKARRQLTGIINLLIIDDSDTDRKLYKIWLRKQPGREYKITEAANAKEGFEAFVNSKPDVIILDFMMYGKDGFQLLVEMKREHTLPPIIFITGMQDHFIRTDALAMGVNSHLDKGVLTAETLYEAVDKALLK